MSGGSCGVYTDAVVFTLSSPHTTCLLSVCQFGLLQTFTHSSTVEGEPALPAWVKLKCICMELLVALTAAFLPFPCAIYYLHF